MDLKIKYFGLLCCFLIVSLIGFSQENPNPEEETVTVTYSKIEYKRSKDSNSLFNVIKINFVQVLNGDIPIYYERRFGNKFTVEIGAGILLRDYVYDFIQTGGDYYDKNENRKMKIGYSLRAMVRFYPSDYKEAPEGFWIGPAFRFRKYRSDLVDCGYGQIAPLPFAESRTLIDGKIMAGYSLLLGGNIIMEFYGGLGVRHSKVLHADCEELFNNLSNEDPTIAVVKLKPAISLGVKLGFAF